MIKGRDILKEKRAQIVNLNKDGKSQRKIVRIFGVSNNGVATTLRR